MRACVGEMVGMNDPRVKDNDFIARAAVQNVGLRVPLVKMPAPVTGADIVARGGTVVKA